MKKRMGKKENKLNVTALGKIFCVIYLMLSLFNLSCSSPGSSSPDAPPRNVANELNEVCSNLPAIPDSAIVNNEESKQTNAVVFTTVYESAVQPEDVEPLFVNSLTAKGWESSTEQSAEDVTTVKFRKNNFSVTLEYYKYQFLQNNKYTVRCAWKVKQ